MNRNRDVAEALLRIADLLEARGDSAFRVNAYRRAAESIADLTDDVEDRRHSGTLISIPGVGESIAAKIDELLRTGRSEYLERLERTAPAGVTELTTVPGLGPVRAREIVGALGVRSIGELAEAAREHRLRDLPGIGEKREATILREAERIANRTRRMLLSVALPAAEEVAGLIAAHTAVQRADPVGSSTSASHTRSTSTP